ncbi:MAG: ABC transporter substrate-binding protein, partial [Gammaproteobacteria bacterium]|nr:ABC transporter substrate-binding protein [Gammaproteobacteria bacterium]
MKKTAVVIPVLLLLAAVFYGLQTNLLPMQSGPRVIALVQLTEVDASTVAGFKAGLEAAGYHEGKDVVYLNKGPAGKIDRLDRIIRDHLRHNPDLIMVSSTPGTMAVKRLTEGKTIPVVFAPVNDPISAGIVADLRRPAGHITGIRLPTGDDLRLKWLLDIAPQTRRVFVPYTPGDKSAQKTLENISAVAPGLGIELLTQPVVGEKGVEAMLESMPANVDAIFLPRDSSIESHIKAFVA